MILLPGSSNGSASVIKMASLVLVTTLSSNFNLCSSFFCLVISLETEIICCIGSPGLPTGDTITSHHLGVPLAVGHKAINCAVSPVNAFANVAFTNASFSLPHSVHQALFLRLPKSSISIWQSPL